MDKVKDNITKIVSTEILLKSNDYINSTLYEPIALKIWTNMNGNLHFTIHGHILGNLIKEINRWD